MASTWFTSNDVQAAYEGDDWTTVMPRADFWVPKALGRAQTVAPCFLNPESLPEHIQEAAKGILVTAVLRKLDDPKGSRQFQAAGPFSYNTDTKRASDRILTIADRDELKQLNRAARGRRRGGSLRTTVGY